MEPADLYKKYLDITLRFLSFRSRSEKEVRDSLIKKQASNDTIEQIVEWLKDHKFLDDKEFARRFTEQRIKLRPRGMRVIKMELRQKGISQEIIEEITAKNEGEEDNELAMAKRIVEKKIIKYKGLEKRDIYQKLGSHLASKGFNWDIIKQSIDSCINNSS
jgi:regulatory protein